MLKKTSIFQFLSIIAMVFLVYYTYRSILTLGFEAGASSFAAITAVFFVVAGVGVMVVSRNRIQTSFSLLWILWAVWLFVDFYLLGLRGTGASTYFLAVFAPFSFLFFYTIALYSDRIRQVGIVGFMVLYVLAYYLIIVNIGQIMNVSIGEDVGVSNLIYWCLCAIPIILLVNKKWVRSVTIVLSILIVLVTGKRSATIAIALVLLTYILDSTSSGERKKGSTIGIIIFVMVLYFVISRYLEGTFLGVINRLGSMQEDRGSGRLTIYQDVINVLKENNFADWLVGRGQGSIKVTRHSNAHNDPLQMLFEFGIVGLMGYIILLVNIFKRLIVLRKSKSTNYLSYAASVIITVVLGLVSNLVVFHSYFAFICAYWGIVEADLVNNNMIKRIRFE